MKQENKKTILILLFGIFLSVGTVAQNKGMLSINSTPPGAKVFVNGENTSKTTPFQTILSVGNYTYTIKKSGFKDYSGNITIKEDGFEVVNTRLEKQVDNSVVQINTTPDGAQVFIDGREKGTTPVSIKNLSAGKHKLKIYKTRYNTITTSFNYDGKAYKEIEYTLETEYVLLGITAYPDADIYIDGEKVGTRIYTADFLPGKHTVEARKEGYITQKKEIEIEKGKDLKLQFELIKFKSNLQVNSTPTDAKVYADNKYIGQTPVDITNLEPGEHEIKIVKEDYKAFYKLVNITSADLVKISSTLMWGETVQVNSQPSGATVYINDEQKGTTPFNTKLKKGKYNLKLLKKGFETKQQTIEITKSEIISLQLKELKAVLTVKTLPNGAKIFVNNEQLGKTPFEKSITQGTKKIKIQKKGFKPIEETVLLEKKPVNLEYNLDFDKVRTKGNAIFYSALFPGAGQAYLLRKGTPYLMGVAALGALGGYFYFANEANSAYELYNIEYDETARNAYKQDYQNNLDKSNYFLYGAIGIYAINLIWVAIMPDDTKRIKNVAFSANLNPQFNITELQLSIKF